MNTNKLHKIKDTGFKVPEDYFDSLEDSILNELKLTKFEKASGYKTPENYFESLEEKITSTIKHDKDGKVIKLFTWRKATYVAAAAASLILLINVYFNQTKSITIDTIETASIEDYIINEDLETYEIASLFTEEDLSDVQLIHDSFSSETLESYIFDNVEIEDIILK